MKRKVSCNLWVVWGISVVVFIIDFLIKTFLRDNFPYQSIPIIENILHITVIFNTGAAFGILKGETDFLIYSGLIFILIFLSFIRSEREKRFSFFLSCGLILGGACSNLYDRIFLGYVVDYIDIRIWPIFNLSDACISTGIFFLILGSFKKKATSINKK